MKSLIPQLVFVCTLGNSKFVLERIHPISTLDTLPGHGAWPPVAGVDKYWMGEASGLGNFFAYPVRDPA